MATQIVKKFVNLIEFTVLFFFVGLSVYGVVYTYDSISGNTPQSLYSERSKSNISVKQIKSSSLQNIRVYEVDSKKNSDTDLDKNDNELKISNFK
ncbi:hypothetical protein AAEX28_10105 [Lentisphaerota bacterium WC36G]|nr:hypothetical protein LJT99_12940 [Lentisphaerae bacterium WC36]